MKALVGAFNQEKALVGAFSVIVKTDCETDGALHSTSIAATLLSSVLQSAHAPMCGACSGHCVGTAASLGQSQPRPAVSSVVQAVTHPRYLHI